MAMPQWAMAQPGAWGATSENASAAGMYVKECSSATARLKPACTFAEQELGNETAPSFSGAAWSCWAHAAAERATRRSDKSLRKCMIATSQRLERNTHFSKTIAHWRFAEDWRAQKAAGGISDCSTSILLRNKA